MMVFRRSGRTTFEAKVPKRDGTWSKEPTGTKDRVTAKAIDHMLDVLRRKEKWALLEAVTRRPRQWTLAELYRRWQETPRTKADSETGEMMEPSVDERIKHVQAQLVSIDVDPLVEKFHAVLIRPGEGISEDTANHYRAAVRLYIPKGTPCAPAKLNERELRVWIEEMDDVAPATVRKRGIGMGRFTAWLVGRGVLAVDPMRDIKLPPQGDPLTHYVDTPDVITLADTIGGQMRLFEVLLPGTGLEVSTALGIRVRAVSFLDKEIHAPGTKTSARNRVVRVAEYAMDAVKELVKGKHPDTLLFDLLPHRWYAGDEHRETVKALGEKGHRVFVEWEGKEKLYTMRDHRHTWAVRAARSGMPPAAIAEQLGHSDGGVLALKVYGKFSPKKEERDRWELMATARDEERAAESKRLKLVEGGGS